MVLTSPSTKWRECERRTSPEPQVVQRGVC